jgi:hypothetical protein
MEMMRMVKVRWKITGLDDEIIDTKENTLFSCTLLFLGIFLYDKCGRWSKRLSLRLDAIKI